MALTKSVERLQQLHSLITEQKTGSPKELAKQLGVSRSYLYMMLDDLKMLDLHIAYSHKNKTFYYETEEELEFKLEVRPLLNEDLININGGGGTFLFPSTILDGTNLSLYSYLAECKE